MYTFLFLALLGFLIAGIVFGKKIKQNQFGVVLIVFTVSLIGTSIVNGILGSKIPFTKVETKRRSLFRNESNIEVDYKKDSTVNFDSYLEFNYRLQRNGDVYVSYLETNGDDWEDPEKVTIEYLSEGDSIPYYKIVKQKRIANNKWITQFGLPGGLKHVYIYIPDDSIHNVLMKYINELYFVEDDKEIAKLN